MVDRPPNNRDFDPDEADYSRRLYDTLLSAIIGIDADESGTGGIVRPHVIRTTLADLAAAIDNNCGLLETPRDRRRFGDDMSERYKLMAKSLVESDAASAWAKATKIEPGTVN